MSKHSIHQIVTVVAIVLYSVVNYYYNISIWNLILILFIHFGILLYGVLNLDFNYFFTSITQGAKDKKQIALTFDDGPVPQTVDLLNILKEHNVKASFFCIGENVKNHSAIAKQLDDEGHIIGNHSFYHKHTFNLQSVKSMHNELVQTNEIIKQTVGKTPLLFRPPNGISNPMLAKALKKTNLKSIAWNVRTFDTHYKNADKIFERIKSNLDNGDIILMHDTMPHTKKLVLNLIKYCKENQIHLVRLDELLNIKTYE